MRDNPADLINVAVEVLIHPPVAQFYRSHRSLLFQLVDALMLVSTSQDTSLLAAVDYLKTLRNRQAKLLPATLDGLGAPGHDPAARPADAGAPTPGADDLEGHAFHLPFASVVCEVQRDCTLDKNWPAIKHSMALSGTCLPQQTATGKFAVTGLEDIRTQLGLTDLYVKGK